MILVIGDICEFDLEKWIYKYNDLLILSRKEKSHINIKDFILELGKGAQAVENLKKIWFDILRKLKYENSINIDEIELVLIHVGKIDRCSQYEPYIDILEKSNFPNNSLIRANYYSSVNSCMGYLKIFDKLQEIYRQKAGNVSKEDMEELENFLEVDAYFLPIFR